MPRATRSVLAAALLLTLSAQPSRAAKALVWATGNGSNGTQAVATWIHDLGCYQQVEAIDANLVSLATLQTYDALFYFSSSSTGQNPTAIGDVLADYADTGRRLVVCTFAWANQGGNTLGGRLITSAMCPLLSGPLGSLYSPVSMASNDASPFFIGVTTVGGYYHDDVTLAPGAVQHATWSDGEPLLATKGNIVAVDLYPDDYYTYISGDYRMLFVNALCVNNGPTAARQPTWGALKLTYR